MHEKVSRLKITLPWKFSKWENTEKKLSQQSKLEMQSVIKAVVIELKQMKLSQIEQEQTNDGI